MTRRAAVVGAAGQLGRSVRKSFEMRGWDVLAVDRSHVDIATTRQYRHIVDWGPSVVVNCAAWTNVDGCARDPAQASLVNGIAPGRLARACIPAHFVQISTNEVFAGDQQRPYREDDAPNPINPYGRSKLLGEFRVRESGAASTIVRTAWLFGPGGSNFVTKIRDAAISAVARGEPLRVVSDEWGNPTWTPSLADALVDVLERPGELPSLLHLAGQPPATRLEWAQAVVRAASLEATVTPINSAEFVRESVPPLRALLDTGLARSMGVAELRWLPPLADYVRDL